ncbi:MAG: response regulator, partial [Clostridia bacterium]|nr:response regulator [Clostridia bacterium]
MAPASYSRFRIWMPAAQASRSEGTVMNSPFFRVVVVDDERLTAANIANNITACDSSFEICAICYDGLSALAAVEQHCPHLLFTDIKMPLLDGRRVSMNGTACYVAGGLSGLHVYDMSNPENPAETYWYDTGGGYANSVIVRDGKLFVGSHLQTDEPIIAFSAESAFQPKKLGVLKANDAVFNS